MTEAEIRGQHSIAAIRAMPEAARAMIEDRSEQIARVADLLAPARRVLLVGTYRDVELSRQHPLAETSGA